MHQRQESIGARQTVGPRPMAERGEDVAAGRQVREQRVVLEDEADGALVRRDVEAGGGALGAINSHIIDSFNWFLETEVSSVFCQLQTHVKQRPFAGGFRDVTTDDEANMLLRFADGELTSDATGLVSVSMVEQPEYVNRLELFGTDGAIRVEHRGEVFIAKSGEKEWTQIHAELSPTIPGIPDTGFSRGFMSFAPRIVEAIRSGSNTIEHAATFADGVRVQRVLDAARASSAQGLRVNLQSADARAKA